MFYDNNQGCRLISEFHALALYITAPSGHVKNRWYFSPVLLNFWGIIPAIVPRTWCSVIHKSAPVTQRHCPLSSWPQRRIDTGPWAVQYHSEKRSSSGSASDKWRSGSQWHWWYKWPYVPRRKTWKSEDMASQFCFQIFMEFRCLSIHLAATLSNDSSAFSSVGAW